jgi:hypothetical protein
MTFIQRTLPLSFAAFCAAARGIGAALGVVLAKAFARAESA